MRRRKLLVALAGLAVVLATGAVVLWPARDRIAAARQITAGKSRSEVESVLGPPGDYTSGPGQPGPDFDYLVDARKAIYRPAESGGPDWLSPATEWWLCDAGCIAVCFDRDNKAEVVVLLPFARDNQGPLENLLGRAERQWHRWFPE